MPNKSQPKMDIVRTQSDPFMDQQENKLIKCHQKAQEYKDRLLKFTTKEIELAKISIKYFIEDLKKEWPALFDVKKLNKIYVHVDLDAFYANCEALSKPEYKTIPIGVGTKMMLATSNYEARKYGVKAGMPGYKGLALCPQLVIVKPDFAKYNYYSERVMEILTHYDTKIEIYGIDEACLSFDVDKLIKAYFNYENNDKFGRRSDEEKSNFDGQLNFENVEWLINKIRAIVYRNTGLTISAGISVCRGIAKYSSDVQKPNGQFSVKDNFQEFLSDKGVDKINGIGKYTKEMLNKTLAITTIKDLKENLHNIYLMLKEKSFMNLFRLSFGLIGFDRDNIIEDLNTTKSVARDFTFIGTDSYFFLCDALWDISEELAARMNKHNYLGFVITLKVRFHNFESTTKQKKLDAPIKDHITIFNQSYKLLMELFSKEEDRSYKTFYIHGKINLIGIRISDIFSQNEYDSIKKYNIQKFEPNKNFKDIVCCICNMQINNKSTVGYDKHVLKCIEKQNKKERKMKKTIFRFLKSTDN